MKFMQKVNLAITFLFIAVISGNCSLIGTDPGSIIDPGITISYCGDSILDSGEECDDGNNTSGDGCSAACLIEAYCGDGVVDSGEECDDGNTTSGDGCSSSCLIEAYCGDGSLDIGEECDDGNNVSGDGCSSTCIVENVSLTCGDGVIDALEQCDDGNTLSGDGCSSICYVEADSTEDTNNSMNIYTPTITLSGTGATGTITAGDSDFYAINIASAGTYSFETNNGIASNHLNCWSSQNGRIDTRINLYDSTGTYLAGNDDGGAGRSLCSLVEYTFSTAGTYYLEVYGFSAGSTYPKQYTLMAGNSPDAYESDGNDYSSWNLWTPITNFLGIGAPQIHTFHMALDQDYMAIAVTAGAQYTVTTSDGVVGNCVNTPDTVMDVYDDFNGYITGNDDWFGVCSQVVFTAGYTGNVYVKITEFSGMSDTNPYTIHVSSP